MREANAGGIALSSARVAGLHFFAYQHRRAMQLIKTLFWVIVAVAVVIFSMANWTVVRVNLWSGLELDVKLPLLLGVAFLLGLLPTLVLHWATRWRLRKRLDVAERNLADTQAAGAGLETVPFAEPPTLP